VLGYIEYVDFAMKRLYKDKNGTTYQLITEISTDDLNWLFIPGGAGMDSSYLHDLIRLLKLPGKCWAIDFINNGRNIGKEIDFLNWKDYLVDLVKLFSNPIIVGHSFGAMLPLMTPALDDLLSGFVAINSSPVYWMPAREKVDKTSLPDLTTLHKKYRDEPNEKNFRAFFRLAITHLVSSKCLEAGYELLKDLPYNFKAYDWWLQSSSTIFKVRWLPKNIPILIICGSDDKITPAYLFTDDSRFISENIDLIEIPGGSHLCWLEGKDEVYSAF
jgi:pimeloyl-ACP methyl ester carboxylesterase